MSVKPEGYYQNKRPEMLSFIPAGTRRVLDVGCGDGSFADLVRHRTNAVVWGVEPDPDAARIAARRLHRVLRGCFDTVHRRLKPRSFDCIVFNDVLEHMAEPWSALLQVKRLLKPGGVVVCSIPNVLHVSVLKTLLWDRDWRYVPYGILDNTHLRFFTKKSIRRMFDGLGYDLFRIEGINANRNRLTKFVVFMSFGYFAESRYLQYACVARPRTAI